MAVPIFAITGFFASIIVLVYMGFKTRHQQRMALIESGQSAEIFSVKNLNQRDASFKLGLLMTGAGIGFLLGFLWSEMRNIDEIIMLPCTLIGGGIGLIIFYLITKNKDNDYSYNE